MKTLLSESSTLNQALRYCERAGETCVSLITSSSVYAKVIGFSAGVAADFTGGTVRLLKWSLFLVLLDFISGTIVGWRGKQVDSTKNKSKFGDFIGYGVAIITAFHVGQISPALGFLLPTVVTVIGFSETLSIFENLYTAGIMPKWVEEKIMTRFDVFENNQTSNE